MNTRTSQFLVGAAMLGLLAGNAAFANDGAAAADAGADAAKTPAKEAHHCKTGGHCMAKGKAKAKAGKKADKEAVPAPAPAETETK